MKHPLPSAVSELKTGRSIRLPVPRYCVSLFILIALFLLLAGCWSTKPAVNVMIDQALMQPCQAIPPVPTRTDGKIELGELVLADIELAGLYRECARGKQGLIDAVNQRASP